jgi:hypothetical protein
MIQWGHQGQKKMARAKSEIQRGDQGQKKLGTCRHIPLSALKYDQIQNR